MVAEPLLAVEDLRVEFSTRRGTVFAVDSYRVHYEEVRVLGSFHFSPRDVRLARDHLLDGELECDPLISGCVPLDEEAYQALMLAHGPPWPSMSSMLRAFMRPVGGRVVLFGLWLWIGWHLFIRGWTFFLRG